MLQKNTHYSEFCTEIIYCVEYVSTVSENGKKKQ